MKNNYSLYLIGQETIGSHKGQAHSGFSEWKNTKEKYWGKARRRKVLKTLFFPFVTVRNIGMHQC